MPSLNMKLVRATLEVGGGYTGADSGVSTRGTSDMMFIRRVRKRWVRVYSEKYQYFLVRGSFNFRL